MKRTEVPDGITLAQALARLEKRILQNAKNNQREGMIRDWRRAAHPEAHDAGSEEHSSENQADRAKEHPQVGLGEPEKARVRRRNLSFFSMRHALGDVRLPDPVGDFRLHEEGVSLSRDSLHVKRLVGGIPQGYAKFVDGGIHISVVIDVCVRGPEANAQLFARHDFTRLFEECEKRLVDFPLKLEPGSIPCDFLPLLINPEWPKMDVTT